MGFDVADIAEEQCREGNLNEVPIYDLLLRVFHARATGRLTLADEAGDNHMFFRQGKPVGVYLAEFAHPLGQLLLELGRIDGSTFLKAQRRIFDGQRLPGQVFIELGVVTDDSLKEVLQLQARRKAETFCGFTARPFTFCRGLTFLTGFTATPLDVFAVVFLAVRASFSAAVRELWINAAREQQVRIINAAGDETGLPAPLAAFGFGVAEERFLKRMVGGWERVGDLLDNGTLPAADAAALMRFLEVIGRLERRAPLQVPAHVSALFQRPAGFEEVFTSNTTPLAAPKASGEGPRAAASVLPAIAARRPSQEMAQEARTPVVTHYPAPTPTAPRPAPRHSDPPRAPLPRVLTMGDGKAPVPEPSTFAGPDDVTDPRQRRLELHDVPTSPLDNVAIVPPPAPAKRVTAELPFDTDVPAPIVKKKKVRRAEPLPSSSSGALVSETRKERTHVGPMPTILIEDE